MYSCLQSPGQGNRQSTHLGLALDTDGRHLLPFPVFQESVAQKGISEKKTGLKTEPPYLSIHTEATESMSGVREDGAGGEELLQVVWKHGRFHSPSILHTPPPTFCLSSVLLNRAENPLYRKSYTSGV